MPAPGMWRAYLSGSTIALAVSPVVEPGDSELRIIAPWWPAVIFSVPIAWGASWI